MSGLGARLRPALVTLVGALALAGLPAARADDLDEDFQVWAPTYVQVDLAPKVLRLYLEAQPRFVEDASRLGFVLWRPALAYYAQDWLTLWAGYAYVERYWPSYVGEHRSWEQVQAARDLVPTIKLNGLARLRLEQRFREGEETVAHRLRLFLRGSLPIGDPEPPSWYAVVWDEVFVGLNTTHWGRPEGVPESRATISQPSGFDRNRTFAGFGFMPWRQLRIEAGYLFEVVHVRGPRDELGHHTLLVALWIELP